MESESSQGNEKDKIYKTFPFLHYVKGRLVDYVDTETKRRYTGHVAMYYKDSGKIRIDWDNGATTYHNFKRDSCWLFKTVNKKKEEML